MTEAEETLYNYVAARKPLLHINFENGITSYVCNLVIINNYTFGNGEKIEGIAVAFDYWYMPSNYGVSAVRLLKGKLNGGKEIWDIGHIELRPPLPHLGETKENDYWIKNCKQNINDDFFEELQSNLSEHIIADYGLIKQ